METWETVKLKACKKGIRYVTVKISDAQWCVDDVLKDKTKAIFYDEACKELAEDFCRQINKAVNKIC